MALVTYRTQVRIPVRPPPKLPCFGVSATGNRSLSLLNPLGRQAQAEVERRF